MVGQQRQSSTTESLQRLRQAEQKVLSALNHAAQATKTLSTANPSQATSFSSQSESFLKDLYAAQALVRQQIQLIEIDRPYENITMRRLVDTDIAVQRTAHIHRSLVRILAALDEPCEGLSTAASPGYMPSPVASTPGLGGLGGIAPSPPAAGGPIMVAVPSPATDGVAGLSAQVGLNGGLAEGAEMQDPSADQVDA